MKYYGNLGLKNWSKGTEGCGLKHKLHTLRRELHSAWERAWYGYSSDDIWDLNSNLESKMIAMLKTFKEGSPFILIDPDTKKEFTEDEADAIYVRIIECIEYSRNEDLCSEELYGKSMYDDEYDFSMDEYKAINNLMAKYKHEAFELLEKYWYQLWW